MLCLLQQPVDLPVVIPVTAKAPMMNDCHFRNYQRKGIASILLCLLWSRKICLATVPPTACFWSALRPHARYARIHRKCMRLILDSVSRRVGHSHAAEFLADGMFRRQSGTPPNRYIYGVISMSGTSVIGLPVQDSLFGCASLWKSRAPQPKHQKFWNETLLKNVCPKKSVIVVTHSRTQAVHFCSLLHQDRQDIQQLASAW